MKDIDAALAKGELKFRLDGYKLKGSWVLVRIGNRAQGEARTWLLIKHRDEWSGDLDVTESFSKSVKSSGDFAEILAADTPSVWRSNRPSRGGVAGAMLAEIIEQAAALKAARRKKKPQATRSIKRKRVPSKRAHK
jgi:bifunctional non-homologous end joining protein LigD